MGRIEQDLRDDQFPDVRDGLTRPQRVVLWVLSELQVELGGRHVPTAMLYGRVVEHIDITSEQLSDILRTMGAADRPTRRCRPADHHRPNRAL